MATKKKVIRVFSLVLVCNASILVFIVFTLWDGEREEGTFHTTDPGSYLYRNITLLPLVTHAYRGKSIAIGGGLKYPGRPTDAMAWEEHVKNLPLFQYFLPTFCKTASQGYYYHFYFKYDFNDALFGVPEAKAAFVSAFQQMKEGKGCRRLTKLELSLSAANYSGNYTQQTRHLVAMPFDRNHMATLWQHCHQVPCLLSSEIGMKEVLNT